MSTELTVSEPQRLAPADFIPVAGAENLNPDDFSLPMLKLVQPQTTIEGAEKHPGQYAKTDTGEFFDQPRALVIGIQKTRVLFPAGYEAGNEPLCRSDDAVGPRPEYINAIVNEEVIPPLCANCEFSRWVGDQRPPCQLAENWALILDSGDIAILRLGGTSARTSSTLKNIMRANVAGKRPTYVQFGSLFKRTDKGQFYVATVTNIKERPPESTLELAAQLRGINLAARASDEQPSNPSPNSDGYDGAPLTEDIPF